MVRRGLGCRVRTSRVIGRRFKKISRVTERAVHLIGAYMMEPYIRSSCPLDLTADFEQAECAVDVRFDKLLGSEDGPVNMAFSGEVDDDVDVCILRRSL